MKKFKTQFLSALMILVLLCGCGEAAVSESESPSESVVESEVSSAVSSEETDKAEASYVVPVTWEPSADHLTIEGDEAKELYTRIKAGDYPTLDELKDDPTVAKLDALSAYYKELYGNTADIDTPERKQLREEIKSDFLSLGSARTESVDENGKAHYVYDGELKSEYKMELVLGLPASGKSTRVTDPDSEEMGAFIMDCDVIKAMLPEYKESYGCAADAVHFEGYTMMQETIKEFTEGDLKGTNIILPVVSSDFDDLMENTIKPFEDADYDVRVKFCPAEPNESAARVVARELEGGQLINSAVVFSFGMKPQEVYEKLAPMTNAKGETYGYFEEDEQREAA